ncbi:biogenesis of lysosome-related organelles complex 1 subunit 3-like [Lineus longissimus]|uniref:biogenesis of lysosome-related organelles complex 1 subunit 3-like n=1 Tax=Lineus longissimus TaxID=88925 RepID=UPI002B4E3C3E
MEKDQALIAGEASESDVDEEVANIAQNMTFQADGPTCPMAVSVRGEASESDGDDMATDDLPPLKVDAAGVGDENATEPTPDDETGEGSPMRQTSCSIRDQVKYDTLLHRKLKERNISLRRNLVIMKSQAYLRAGKELKNTTQQLIKSQSAIQDVSNNMRLLTNDLFHLEDKIDIITSCQILPDLHPRSDRQQPQAAAT